MPLQIRRWLFVSVSLALLWDKLASADTPQMNPEAMMLSGNNQPTADVLPESSNLGSRTGPRETWGATSFRDWFQESRSALIGPIEPPVDLDQLTERLKDLDRADPRFDWSAVRNAKKSYHLFNPTPRPLRREFITDRPDKTINPVTVDAGYLQVETDLVTATFDRRQPRSNLRLLTLGFSPKTGTGGFLQQQPFTAGDKDDYVFLLTNFRIGLTNQSEAHIFLRPFQQLSNPGTLSEPPTNTFGFGDIRVLLKENLWGNEGGPTAFALTQYLDLPAGQSGLSTGALEGGLTGTFLLRYPKKTYVGFETGLEWRQDIFSDQYHLEVPASVSVAFSFTPEWSAKAEFAAVFSTEPGAAWVGVVSLATLYELAEDLQFDVGINIGVTPAANDWNPFIGLAKRF